MSLIWGKWVYKHYVKLLLIYFINCVSQTDDALHQSSVPDTAACTTSDVILPADADIYDIQCVALSDGRVGRWRWILSVLLEKVSHCGCDGALSLAANQDHRQHKQRADVPLQSAMSHR